MAMVKDKVRYTDAEIAAIQTFLEGRLSECEKIVSKMRAGVNHPDAEMSGVLGMIAYNRNGVSHFKRALALLAQHKPHTTV
jgi:hypothetical protein